MKRVVISRNRYFDSVFLMQVAQRMTSRPGIRDASALLATDANKKVLAGLGYGEAGCDAAFAAAGPNDLVIALEGEEAAVAAIAANPDSWLRQESAATAPGQVRAPRSIREAVAARTDANLAVISVPGRYAAREARSAIEQGLNVFLFSSNVAVKDELSLKTMARARGLIVMGPDCGTAYIAGAGIGFANAVRRGPIGIVGSSGTGMQEFSSLVHRAGSGISHGIGVGSHDLSDEVGGISTFMALDALEADPQTRVMAVIAKPPGRNTEEKLVERCLRSRKPVVLCLLDGTGAHERRAGMHMATIIDDAVDVALEQAGQGASRQERLDLAALRALAAAAVAKMKLGQRYVRGLFAGGTFCYQTQVIFRNAGLAINSNAPVIGTNLLADPRKSVGSTLVDMGAELFVEAYPHPMIDATLRRKRLRDESADPEVAMVILDFVLGTNASRDPVGDLLPTIREAMESAQKRGAHLCVAASVCGTDGDPQDLNAQMHFLTSIGVQVFTSSAQAAAFSREVALLLAVRNGAH